LRDYRKIFSEKNEIEVNTLITAKYNFAILAKNCGDKIKSGIEQRDAAVKTGAKGAMAIIFKDGRFTIPSVSSDVTKDFPKLAKQLIKVFKPGENDVVIVGGADAQHLAEYGAMAAAWTLLEVC